MYKFFWEHLSLLLQKRVSAGALWPNSCFTEAGGAGAVTKSLHYPGFVASAAGGRQVMTVSSLVGVEQGFVALFEELCHTQLKGALLGRRSIRRPCAKNCRKAACRVGDRLAGGFLLASEQDLKIQR